MACISLFGFAKVNEHMKEIFGAHAKHIGYTIKNILG
jgi:hypothetical protein